MLWHFVRQSPPLLLRMSLLVADSVQLHFFANDSRAALNAATRPPTIGE
jgi:hypothetical protein